MSREDYLAQRIRNLESDKDNLISILVVKLWCPKQAAIFDGFDKECMSPDTCGTSSIDCACAVSLPVRERGLKLVRWTPIVCCCGRSPCGSVD